MSDPLSELFRTLRVRSAVYFAEDFSAPWGLALPKRPHMQVHVVLHGACVVRHEGTAFALAAREAVLFPNGATHSISDGGGGPLKDGREVVQAIRRGDVPLPGKQPAVRLLSGHIEFDRAARHPLLRDLPEIVHVRAASGFDAPLSDALVSLISAEAGSRLPGAEMILERLAEIFLVRALRAHVVGSPSARGLLGALFDPRLGVGVALMHARGAEPLTLAALARAAGMSRSAFAHVFRQATDMTPMAYLARWRLVKGRDLLADPTRSVAQVAVACGHRSTEGFSRAFRRVYGQSPTAVRRELAAGLKRVDHQT